MRAAETDLRSNVRPKARGPLAALIVTYGDRWHLLRQVLLSVDAAQEVSFVVIVANGSYYNLVPAVRRLKLGCRVEIVHENGNVGSGRAVADGLEIVHEIENVSHVLILDDDNVPAPGALRDIVCRLDRLGPLDGFVLHRHSRPEIRRAAGSGRPVRNTPNSFVGVSLRAKIARLYRGVARVRADRGPIVLDYAPFGGLVIGKSLAQMIGPPSAEYFLYGDDHDFTTRISRSGGTLTLVESARLDDIDLSWHLNGRIIPAADIGASAARVYYAVRNRVFFEGRFLARSRAETWVNERCFWILVRLDLAIQCLHGASRAQVRTRLALLRAACRDGKSGHLGSRAHLDPMTRHDA